MTTAATGIAHAQSGMGNMQQQQPQQRQQQAAAIHPGALYDAALKFAQVIDAGQAGILWDNGSSLIKQKVKRENFVATVATARADAGPLTSRNWRAIEHQYSSGGQIPAGEYASVNLAIVAGGKPGSEVVTFRHDEDGAWRFVGYVIQR